MVVQKAGGLGEAAPWAARIFNCRMLLGFQTASVVHVVAFKVVEEVSARFGVTKTIRILCKTNIGLRNQH